MRSTIDVYNEGAETFIERYDGRLHLSEELRTRFMALLTGPRVLDLGSGSGSHAQWFAARGLDVTCLDGTERLLQSCRDRGFKTLHQDYHHLELPPGAFDGVYARNSLLHARRDAMPDIVGAIHRALTPGGAFAVSVKDGEGEETVDDGRTFTYFREGELIDLLTPAFRIAGAARQPTESRDYLWIWASAEAVNDPTE